MTMTQTLTDSLQVQEAIFRTLWPDSSSPTHTHACFLTLPHFYMGSDLQKMGFCTKPGAADWVACPALGFGPWLVAPAQSPAALPLLSHSCSLWEVRTKWEPVVSLPLKASQNPDPLLSWTLSTAPLGPQMHSSLCSLYRSRGHEQ